MKSKEFAINYLDMHPDKLTDEFIALYLTYYIDENNLFDYVKNFKTGNKNCYYTKEKRIIINPNFVYEENLIKKFMTKKTKERLKTLICLYALKHELNHALQIKMAIENSYITDYFKKGFKNSMRAANIDKYFFDGKYYNKCPNSFLFESYANTKAIVEIDDILKELSDKYPKKIYNVYAAKRMLNIYKEDQFPIKTSNMLYNKILKKAKNFDNDEINQCEYAQIQEHPIHNFTTKELITYGYPIDKNLYDHFVDIKSGKKKVKTLF